MTPATPLLSVRNLRVSFRNEDDAKHDDRCSYRESEECRDLRHIEREDEVREVARDARDDTREDDERHTVADAELRDELADPHEEDRSCGDDHHVGDKAQERQGRYDTVLLQEQEEAERLDECERNREVARVLHEALAAGVPFSLIHLFERRHEDRQELHDDGSGDVRTDTEHYDRERRESTAREDVEKSEELVVAEEGFELRTVDTRDRDSGEQAEHDERPKDEQYPLTQRFVFEDELYLAHECVPHRL